MRLRILEYGDPRLLEQGNPIIVFDDKLKKFAEDMIETMHANDGMGLAAHQVGQPINMYTMDLRGASDPDMYYLYDGKKPPIELFCPLVIINPKVEILANETSCYSEGCLSFLDIRGDVERPDLVRVTFQDLQGAPHTLECDGYAAHCVQHEGDHLNGILFIERMETRVLNALLPQLKQIKRNTRDFLKKREKEKH